MDPRIVDERSPNPMIGGLLVAGMLTLVGAPGAAEVTSSDYARAERFLPWNASKLLLHADVLPQWIEESSRFWYRKRVAAGHEFIYVDPASGEQRPAFDHERLASSLSKASGHSYVAYKLPFSTIELIAAGDERVEVDSLRFWEKAQPEDDGEEAEEERDEESGEADGVGDEDSEPPHRRWTCRLDTYACAGPDDVEPDRADEVESPDEQWVAFEREENLWLRNQASGEERQLTTDGETDYGYAVLGEGCCSEITSRRSRAKRRPPIYWSPDSTRLATIRLDEREVEEMHLLEAKVGRPVLHSYRYALPGDESIPLYRIWIFDVDSGEKREVEGPAIELFWPGGEALVNWTDDSSSVFFLRVHRGYQQVTLYRADPATGTARTVIDEKSRSFIETNMTYGELADWRATADGSQVIWRSERDGWGHFYLYDSESGDQVRQLTSGSFSAARIEHVDEEGGWLYFHGYGREAGLNPYYAQLYRVPLQGGNIERLTPEGAHHSVWMAKDGSVIVDTYSTFDQPPVTVLRRPGGRVQKQLEEADSEPLLESAWTPPVPFVAKARDGVTDLHGFLYRPSDFDPEKRYPVIDYIYPGPQVGPIRRWGFDVAPAGFVHALAELGFIVFKVNAFGTPFRSKAFHDAWYGDMGDNGIADHIHALKQLAARHPELDLERVGIYGHSGGGFSSTGAILRFPEFFDVAVSGAGNHDQRSYSFGWGEQYQGLLEKTASGDNYDSQANHLLADRLQGKLLLTYGTLDDNVHPNATELLIDKLIEHNKDFDLLVLPNRNHGYANEPYVVRRTWDYFVRHLLGVEPPREYQVAPRPAE